MSNTEKLKALKLTMDKIDKDFGKGSVMMMNERAAGEMEVISTGSIGLDIALGIGGLPKGRVVEIYGPESSGKTTLAIHVIAEAQKKDGMCAIIDMLNYYYQVAPYILPYVHDKPQTLYRFPHGISGEAFYQKDVKGKAPAWVKTFPYYSYADNRDKEFLVITDEASRLYAASLGCIEINPCSSRIQTPDNPDWCIIDLDPNKNTFEQVIEAAQITRQILDALEVQAFPKTSGSTGLHIYIPFGAKYSYEASKEFGRVIAKLVHKQIPEYTSIERKVADRSGKMYIDFLQNRPQATVAGPYSLRPKPGAPVSMPLHWHEVKKGLKITDFNIFNAMSRLKEQGDIFKGVLGKGINLEKTLKKIEKL